MISNYYKSQTGMHADSYYTGKVYPKLDAYIQHGKNGEVFYLCSSCSYRTQKRFKESIRERSGIRQDTIITIRKGKD